MRKPVHADIAIIAIVGLSLSAPCAWGADFAAQARESAARIGRIIGAATTCVFIPPPRVAADELKVRDIVAKFASGHPDVTDLQKSYDLGVGEGKTLVPLKKTNCAFVENDLTNLENLTDLLPSDAAPR